MGREPIGRGFVRGGTNFQIDTSDFWGIIEASLEEQSADRQRSEFPSRPDERVERHRV